WHWDELREIYTDEQIALLQADSNVKKRMPNVVGMSAQQAYNTLTSAGFIVRLTYCYSATSSVPDGYCYLQEVPAGQMWRQGDTFFIWIQEPKPRFHITMFDIFGFSEGQIRGWLANIGYTNVDFQYQYTENGTPAGYCIGYSPSVGTVVYPEDHIQIIISLGPPVAEPSAELSPGTEPSPSPEPTVEPSTSESLPVGSPTD
ncbi:MAG: PASTA domain-containing protein, partial [Bacillota bacterium]